MLLNSLALQGNKLAGALPGAVVLWRSTRRVQLGNNKLSGVALDLEMHLLALLMSCLRLENPNLLK